jgi:hypothetical protein
LLQPDLGRHRRKSSIDRRAWFLLAALPAAALSADLALEIPPVPVSVTIAGQPIALVISGTISASQPFNINLHADLSDFQNQLTSIMQTELNQSNHCGERISIEQTRSNLPRLPDASPFNCISKNGPASRCSAKRMRNG